MRRVSGGEDSRGMKPAAGVAVCRPVAMVAAGADVPLQELKAFE